MAYLSNTPTELIAGQKHNRKRKRCVRAVDRYLIADGKIEIQDAHLWAGLRHRTINKRWIRITVSHLIAQALSGY